MSNVHLDIILRSAAVYAVVILGLRLLGKKHVAQLSIIDLVLILLISNAVQNAMVGDDSSLIGGIVAAATLLVVNYILTIVLYRFRLADKLFEGTPTLLVHNGSAIHTHLAQEKITADELERVIREHGIDGIAEVKSAIMEVDGTVSVVPRAGNEKHIETFKRHRTKFQQKRS
ncbi:MAG: DUF421 domain-containing protein [Ignavibacteriae bacterium]|nr:DUF421 domain-containing protein [Ignavibacteriota bacterium]